MKILLPVDGSLFTKKMLAYLATHVEMFSGDNEFTVLTVQPALPPRARSVVSKELIDAYYQEESDKVLAPVMAFLQRHELKVSSITRIGNAGEVIADTAQAGKFDLVVMGSHGHSALGSLLMGSVASRVLAACNVPVLLVR